jgi:hypothetical protein
MPGCADGGIVDDCVQRLGVRQFDRFVPFGSERFLAFVGRYIDDAA